MKNSVFRLVLFLLCAAQGMESGAQTGRNADRKAEAPAVLLADSDGDGLPDSQDMCPNEPGAAKWSGCPHTEETPKPPASEAVSADPKAAIDSLRRIFYAELDKAVSREDRRLAVVRFGDRVRRGLGVEDGNRLGYAIEPVMRTRGTGDTALADLIAITWNHTTGYPFSGSMNMIPAAEKEAILQRRKREYAAAHPVAAPEAVAVKKKDTALPRPLPWQFSVGMLVKYNDHFYVIDWIDFINSRY